MKLKIKLFSLTFLLIFCFSCGNNMTGKSRIIYLYNPSESIITVNIDNEAIELPPQHVFPKQLLYREHFFEFGKLKDTFYLDTNTNLAINPLLETLISEEIVYIPNNQNDKELTIDDYTREFTTLEINELLYYGPFKLTNELFINDWDYGPGHPVNLQLTEYSHVKANIDSKFSVIKIHGIDEFEENCISINHTEEYINEIISQYLTIKSDDAVVKIKGDELYAGIGKKVFSLADIHITLDEKPFIECWEIYNSNTHGEIKDIKFLIQDCTVKLNDSIYYGKEVQGISVTGSEFLILDIK